MKQARIVLSVVGAVWLLHGSAFAQVPPAPNASQPPGANPPATCSKSAAAQIDGKVESIDLSQEKVTVRGATGEVYTFSASKETLQNYKVGDRIQANLRADQNCKG